MSNALAYLNSALKAHASGSLEGAKYFYQKTLSEDPHNSTALGWLGTIEAQHKNYDIAEDLLLKALAKDKKNQDFLLNYANLLFEKKQFIDAATYYQKTIRQRPNDPICFANLAACYNEQNQPLLGLDAAEKSIKLKPDYAEAWSNRGNALQDLNRNAEAIASHERALELKPNYAEAWSNRGNALHALKRYEEALSSHEHAHLLKSDYAEAWSNCGNALRELKRYDEAIAHYDKAIDLKPDYAEGWTNKGMTLYELKHYEEAIDHYDKVLGLKPDYAAGWINKGMTLSQLKRHYEAIDHYDKALSIKPNYAECWTAKGNSLNELQLYDEAIAHYDMALSLMPEHAGSWISKGLALNNLKRHSESVKCYRKAIDFNVEDSYLLGLAHHQMMLVCDWTNYVNNITQIFHLVNDGRMATEPFGFQGIASSEELLKKCAEIYSNENYPALGNFSEFSKYKNHKIRIGYLCGEFWAQATSILMTRVWELHDKTKFEIFAFDNGWDDGSDYRQRIEKAFTKLFDISKTSDLEVVRLIQENKIDILVNLNGFFGRARQQVFSYRPAPIQVNYLGFPGTIGTEYIDYIIADKVVIPEASKNYYTEKIVYLPNSYQANDNIRKISNRQFSKVQSGLPEDVFVFTCFNNNYKITPDVFDSWMRILSTVQGSVLWLLADNPMAKENLIKEAIARGVDSSRLVFAERLPISEHLARHNLADLFLDTLPYNAHTTCSDALWAGLPVLTLIGNTFPGRVSASLLTSIGLSELITNTKGEYEALAIDLAMNPQKLTNIKLKLSKNRLVAPLFDTPLFATNLEAAYLKMYESHSGGLPPMCINIA